MMQIPPTDGTRPVMMHGIDLPLRETLPYRRNLPLARWRGELASLRGQPGIEWAFRVTRFETSPVHALEILAQYAAEIPASCRDIYLGARVRLAALTYTRPLR